MDQMTIDDVIDATVKPYTLTDSENVDLNSKIAFLMKDRDFWKNKSLSLGVKIANVKEYISEVYMETGEVPDELAEIARMLQISLTKTISGTATHTIAWRAEVPLDFDPDDMQISFSADCQSDDADNFEYDEEDTEIHAREDF